MLKTFDLECYPNFFLATFKDYKTKTFDRFEISDRKNESKELFEYLVKHKKYIFVGFNIVNYDYPLLHNTILTNLRYIDAYFIFKESSKIIESKYSSIKQNLTKLKLVDLFKVWHYDNKNKSASLKWLEFALRMNSIEDLPYAPGTYLTFDQMDEIIEYCDHDINATELFLTKSFKHLTLRKEYSSLESEDMMNYSEIAISKVVFGKALANEMGISRYELNQMRTKRTRVDISEIIFDYLKFNDPLNINTLNQFKSKVWRYDEDQEKALESIKFSVKYKNVIREYAEGGLHSFGKSGIYESDDEYVLVDVDFEKQSPKLI